MSIERVQITDHELRLGTLDMASQELSVRVDDVWPDVHFDDFSRFLMIVQAMVQEEGHPRLSEVLALLGWMLRYT